MSVLKQLPFVKLLFPTVIGITTTILFPPIGQYSTGILAFFTLLFFIFTLIRINKWAYLLASVCVYFLFFGIGSWLTYGTHYSKKVKDQNHIGLQGLYLIQIKEPPQEKTKSHKLTAKIIGRIDKNNHLIISGESVLIYLGKKKIAPKLGDLYITKCIFKPIPKPENPYQFNYKQFLSYQGIHMQAFIGNTSPFIFTGINKAPILKKMANNGSLYLKNLYRTSIKDSAALGVIEALIFGYKDDLPKDIINSYSRTGTLHVLAVSGLHVAIVFLMLAQCLWFLDKWRYGIWLKTILVLASIWAYCILTGLSPSIIRAGLMISLVLLGKALNRNSHLFNTIALSAFIILCLNPIWILNVGFQLSFAAVIGIVYLQEYLLPLWTPPNWLFRQIWTILIISFCAQLATFPLSLYYFNQFPNYFLICNLLIIPLSTIVIYIGIGMVAISKIPILLAVLAWLTEKTVLLTNYLIVSIEQWPFSYSDGIKINMLQLIMLYIGITLLIFWFIKANKKFLIYSTTCLLLISMISCYDKIIQQQKSHFIIFNIPTQNSFLISDGKKSILISDGLDRSKELYYIRGFLIQYRLWPISKVYSLNTILSKTTHLSEIDFHSANGMLFFRGIALNFNPNNLGKVKYKQNYILPRSFTTNAVLDQNMTDTVHIGQDKTKRLQNNLKKYFTNYHNCVIYSVTFRELIN